MLIRYDREADAAYVQITDERVTSTRSIDDSRIVDFGSSGAVRGLEFLWVSSGIELHGLPLNTQPVAFALSLAGLPVIGGIALSPSIRTETAGRGVSGTVSEQGVLTPDTKLGGHHVSPQTSGSVSVPAQQSLFTQAA